MPTTSSESKKEKNSRLHSEPPTVITNTTLFQSGFQAHWLRFIFTSSSVCGPILTTSPCGTWMIYSSTRSMRSSTKTASEMCHNSCSNSGWIARPNSANSESGESASPDLSPIQMESARSQTAYPWLTTDRLWNQLRMCKCSSDWQTSLRDSFDNMQTWWLPYETW